MLATLLLATALNVSAPATVLPSPLPEVADDTVKVVRYPTVEVPFRNGVRGIPGITYWQPPGYRPLRLDLYLPPTSAKRPSSGFPLVIYIHGGAWVGGDPRQSVPFADFPGVLASLSARGYVVSSIEYRLSSEATFPAQAQDVKAAIRWLRMNSSKYGIDPARAVTWGVSAGGHLAALAALSCNTPELAPREPSPAHLTGNKRETAPAPAEPSPARTPEAKPDPVVSSKASDCVQGGVAWYGEFDMATIAEQAATAVALSRDTSDAPEWRLLGCYGKKGCDPQRIAAASPVTYVDRHDPPMLLIAGTGDTTMPYQQTLEMAEKLKSAGVKHELIVLPGINHSFIGETPEETRNANLKALDATFRFIDQTIGNASAPKR